MNLKFGLLNINGLPRTKYSTIQCVIEEEELDILFLQETHRQSNEFYPGPKVDGFVWLENTREEGTKLGGGLGVLINEDFPMADWAGLEQNSERMWLLYEYNGEKTAFCSLYLACNTGRRPQHEDENTELLGLVGEEVDDLKSQGFEVVLLGDMNAWVGMKGRYGIQEQTH